MYPVFLRSDTVRSYDYTHRKEVTEIMSAMSEEGIKPDRITHSIIVPSLFKTMNAA